MCENFCLAKLRSATFEPSESHFGLFDFISFRRRTVARYVLAKMEETSEEKRDTVSGSSATLSHSCRKV